MTSELIMTAIVLAGTALFAPSSDATTLDQYRWKNRLLVVTGPAGDAAAAQQKRIFDTSATGMTERSIIFADATGEGGQARKVRARFNKDGTSFRVYLVGKDGNTAFSAGSPVSASEIFGRVDAMPMRRDEMRRRR